MPLQRSKFNIRKIKPAKATDWVLLERKLEALPEDWQQHEILCFRDLKTLKFKETVTDIIVLAELQGETFCKCGASEPVLKRNGMTPPLMIYDQPIRSKRVSIYYRAQRYFCRDCRKTVQQAFNESDGKHRLTKRLVSYVERNSLSLYKTFTDVAVETGVHEHVVRNLFTAHVKELQSERRLGTPDWIAIDEVHPTTRKYKRCVISEPDKRRVLDILEKDKSKMLNDWLVQIPERHKVKVVSMDMHAPYRRTVKGVLPNARIVVDRYHVQDLLNQSLKEVLAVIREALTATEKKRKMRPEHLLLQNGVGTELLTKDKYNFEIADQEISQEEKKRVTSCWFHEMPDIARAYTLKVDFVAILHLADRQTAERRARVWLEQVSSFVGYFSEKYGRQCRSLRKKPFANVPGTINQWFDEILNYIEFKNEFSIKVTNAFAEYANNQIKRAHRKGNGYNFDVLRAKVVFGPFLKEKFSPHPLKVPIKRGRRGISKKIPGTQISNIFQLIEARENSDQTKDLIPNPRENEACDKRLPRTSVTKRSNRQIQQSPKQPSIWQNTLNTQYPRHSSKIFSEDHRCESRFEQMSLF